MLRETTSLTASLRSTSKGGRLGLAIVALLLGGCTWHPKMFHPNAFDSGKVLPKNQTEIAVQTLGAGISYGFGGGFEGQLIAAFDGEEIGGVELALKRCLRQRDNAFAAGIIGVEWFDAPDHVFTGHRIVAGLTGSVYTQSGRFGLHLPLKVYYMSYDYGGFYREGLLFPPVDGSLFVRVDDQDDGAVFVPGLGLSIEGKHVAFRAAGNLPMREHIGKVEMLPFFGFRLGVKF